MSAHDPLSACTGFDRDDANIGKNWERHRVTPEEAEDVFFHDPFVLVLDKNHSPREKRYQSLGKTSSGRRLFVAFAIRGKLVRVISVRDMNRKENEDYERHEKRDS